jgi:peptide subunit release factor RF-3
MPPRPAAFGVQQGVTYRPRDLPIISFANKLDHQGRDPFDLLDEIEQSLAVDVTLASFFASRRRQNHIGREIAAVWRDDSARGQSHSARRARRRARLRWMSIERGHGISVSEAIMSFEHGTRLQSARLPGSPGFQRGRLPRANRGRQPVMVLDATKGPGGQTQELSEVCRLRGSTARIFDPFDLTQR